MRKLGILLVFALAGGLLVAGCSSSSSDNTPAPTPYNGFAKPAGTIGVTFTVDDTANKVFTAGSLEWKGSMKYDSTTRKITKDGTWSGPWAKLYDDGPYTAATTQHEGPTATAGDNKWSITVFVTPPATGTDTYEYGLNDSSLAASGRLVATNGWIWQGSNGTFTVTAGDSDKTATGITFPAFGTTNMRLKIDKGALAAGTWDTTKVTVKGSGWGWNEIQVLDDGLFGDAAAGDNVWTFELGQFVKGATTPLLPHTGLPVSGATVEFIIVFNGSEYKDGSGNALATGITAETKSTGGAWTTAAITLATNKNTKITIP